MQKKKTNEWHKRADVKIGTNSISVLKEGSAEAVSYEGRGSCEI